MKDESIPSQKSLRQTKVPVGTAITSLNDLQRLRHAVPHEAKNYKPQLRPERVVTSGETHGGMDYSSLITTQFGGGGGGGGGGRVGN